jgi:hypothetical protein
VPSQDYQSLKKYNMRVKKYKKTRLRRGYYKVRILLRKIKKIAKREGKETVVATKILTKYVKGGDLTEKEIKFLKGQGKDIARILPLVVTSALPIPVPLTPILLALGHKIGIDFIPKDQETLEGYPTRKERKQLLKDKLD